MTSWTPAALSRQLGGKSQITEAIRLPCDKSALLPNTNALTI